MLLRIAILDLADVRARLLEFALRQVDKCPLDVSPEDFRRSLAASRVKFTSVPLTYVPKTFAGVCGRIACQVYKCALDICPEDLLPESVAASPAAVGAPAGQSPETASARWP